ncbi:MAG TPA: hypothetical protein PLM33_11815 [Acidobacteriota bacterium]|jgi:hypothetical protein|nr:hypothetical protein [Acidobacteriota bacterium]HRR56128.1 hypothetical protein [Acidobacteriota bacterium]
MWRLVNVASPKDLKISAAAGNEILGARILLLLVLACSLLGGGCIWKLWSKGPPPEERIYDVYGTVESITKDTLVITTRRNQRLEFSMVDSSIKGSDFGPGTYVHVYYRQLEGKPEVTMVVEKRD